MDAKEVIEYLRLDASSSEDEPVGLHGHITTSAIALYIDKACPSPRFETDLQTHLATCAKCQEEIEGVRTAIAEDKAHPERLNATVERIVALMESRDATKN